MLPNSLYKGRVAAASVVSDSVRPHTQQPTRLPCPWDSPGKNTGVGCHFLLQHMKVNLLSRVQPLATPWTAAYQALPSMGFSRQEYWSGLTLPFPGINSKLTQFTMIPTDQNQLPVKVNRVNKCIVLQFEEHFSCQSEAVGQTVALGLSVRMFIWEKR